MLLGQFTLRRYPRLQNKYKSGSNNLSKKMCPAGGNTGTQINQLSIDGGFFLFILRACCNFHIKLFLKLPAEIMKDGKLHTNKLKASFLMNTCNEGVKGNA